MKQSPSWKLTTSQLVQKFPAFYGTHSFMTACTGIQHLSLSWARSNEPKPPHPTSILILFSHLCVGLPDDILPLGLPIKTLCATPLSSVCTTCPIHLIVLDLMTWIIFGEKYTSSSSSLLVFSVPVTMSFFGPNIFLYILLLNTLSLYFSLGARDQVLRPYKVTGKITLPYILIFIFLGSKPEDRRYCTEWHQAFPDYSLPLISSWMEFWPVRVVPKYLICCTLLKNLLHIFLLWFFPACWSRDMIMKLVFSSRRVTCLIYTYLTYETSHKNYTNMQCFGFIFLFYLCVNVYQIFGLTLDCRSSKISGVSFSCFFVCILASVVPSEHWPCNGQAFQ